MSAEVAETDRALRQIRGSNARKIIDHFTQRLKQGQGVGLR